MRRVSFDSAYKPLKLVPPKPAARGAALRTHTQLPFPPQNSPMRAPQKFGPIPALAMAIQIPYVLFASYTSTKRERHRCHVLLLFDKQLLGRY